MSDSAATDDLPVLIDQIAARLEGEGFPEHGRKLHELLHETAWTTSSELIGELGLELGAVQKEARGRLSPELAKAIARGLLAVRSVWPRLR